MYLFRPLFPNDTIGVCAPSGSFDKDLFDMGIGRLEQMGFRVHVPEQISMSKGYLAGEDRHRAQILNKLFASADIDAVVCARGGYGAMRVLPFVDWEAVRHNPKMFIGFSDITALMLPMIQQAKLPVVHGPTVTTLGKAGRQELEVFYKTMTCMPGIVTVQRGKTVAKGQSRGILKGGNIATISHLLGTPFQPDFADSIVFLEDVGEPAYKIDRMLTQMKLAGLFRQVKGVVIGSLTRCGPEDILHDIIHDVFAEFQVPVLAGMDAGHGDSNTAFVMGTRVVLDADGHTLSWETAQ